jgi:hypothetical protein
MGSYGLVVTGNGDVLDSLNVNIHVLNTTEWII